MESSVAGWPPQGTMNGIAGTGSSAVERLAYTELVGGSIPSPCTIFSENPMLARSLVTIGWWALPALAVGAGEPVDALAGLEAGQVQEVLQWLSAHAVEPESLSQAALDRAALRSLLKDDRTGALVLTKAEAEMKPLLPALMARLGPRGAYVRPGALEAEALKPVGDFLTGLPPEVGTLVLDLRASGPPAPLTGAVALTSLFLPEGTPLFLLRTGGAVAPVPHKAAAGRVWERQVWLLMDEGTPPVLELTAHLLARHAAALTFGSKTRGNLTETTDRPLGTDHVVRLPSAVVFWPEGQRLTGAGLVPLSPVAARPEARAALLALTDPATLTGHLTHHDRPRLNEAALLAGTNPELTPQPPPPGPGADPVLQLAADLLEMVTLLKLDAPEEIKRAVPSR
jgi:Peptidase family S41